MVVMAIAPPTTMATIGTSKPPRPIKESINLFTSPASASAAASSASRRNSGGADRDRTGGLLVANQALSQLSYSPQPRVSGFTFRVSRKNTGNQKPETRNLIFWWAWIDLNYRPHPYQGCALA